MVSVSLPLEVNVNVNVFSTIIIMDLIYGFDKRICLQGYAVVGRCKYLEPPHPWPLSTIVERGTNMKMATYLGVEKGSYGE